MRTIICTKANFIKTLEKYWLNPNYKVEAESNPQENKYVVKIQRIEDQ